MESDDYQTKILEMAQEVEEKNQLNLLTTEDLINYFEMIPE